MHNIFGDSGQSVWHDDLDCPDENDVDDIHFPVLVLAVFAVGLE